MTILTLMFSLNSCVNPWIYLAFNRDLVRMLWLLVTCQGTSSGGQVLSAQSGGSGSSPSNTVRRTCFTDLGMGSHMPGPGTAVGRSRSSLESWKIRSVHTTRRTVRKRRSRTTLHLKNILFSNLRVVHSC